MPAEPILQPIRQPILRCDHLVKRAHGPREHRVGARLGDAPAVGIDSGELLESLGLTPVTHRFPDELSMGEQQRVAVARAVAMRPSLLIADEPTAHQDERSADAVMACLAAVADAGGAVIVATHDDRLLDRADRVIALLDGRVVLE